MIKFRKGMTHNYVTTDDNGLGLLRTIVFPEERIRLEQKSFHYGLRLYARSTLQFDLEELMEYYRLPHETGYSFRPDCGYFFDFQMDAVKSFCNTGAELIVVPGTLLHEKGGQ